MKNCQVVSSMFFIFLLLHFHFYKYFPCSNFCFATNFYLTGVKAACAALGRTEKMWNEGTWPDSCDVFYDDLTDDQKDALAILGYSKSGWDETPPPSSPTRMDGTPLPGSPELSSPDTPSSS